MPTVKNPDKKPPLLLKEDQKMSKKPELEPFLAWLLT